MRRLLYVFVILVLVCIYRNRNPSSLVRCYQAHGKTLPRLPEKLPEDQKNIFFLETSCSSFDHRKIVISPRQACAVESAARQNPNFQIYLLYLSSGTLKLKSTRSDKLLQELLKYGNVNMRHVNFKEYVEGSVVENLIWNGELAKSRHFVSHVSDILRYLTLWKHGGIYLDLDTIVLKSLENLQFNFAGYEHANQLGSAVLSFNSTGRGHKLATMCLEDLRDNFDAQHYTFNGPGVISRLIKKVYLTDNLTDVIGEKCLEFEVHPRNAFSPIPSTDWYKLFMKVYLDEVLESCKDSYVVHFWNRLTYNESVYSKSAYAVFAREYCPKVFELCERDF